MPTLKKGLSELARATAALSGKQIRRSIVEYRAHASKVAAEVRAASLPQTSHRPDTGDKTIPEESDSGEKTLSEKPTS